MRSVTFVLGPPDGSHPAYRMFGPGTPFTRERVYHLNVLEDGTVALLGRLRGDLARAKDVVEDRADVLAYSVSSDGSGGDADSGLVFVHARPPPDIRTFLELPRRHEVFFEFPVEGTRDGGLRIVMVGETNEALQAALVDVPEGLDLTVERIGPYYEGGDVTALLTERQREVLSAAMDLGYYEVPRRATHADIAERLDLSVGTVGEHVQKIEARVFGALTG